MKKTLLLTALLFAFVVSTFAHERGERTYGIKFGANFANTPGELLNNFKSRTRTGFVGGVFVRFGDKIALQPELLFSQQGSDTEFVYQNESGTTVVAKDLKLNYLTLPIYLKIRTLGFIYLQAGPQFGYLLSGSTSDDTIDKDFFKALDFGVNFGLSVNLPFGLVASGTYNLGLGNVADQDSWKTLKGNTINSYKMRNGTVQLMVGLRF